MMDDVVMYSLLSVSQSAVEFKMSIFKLKFQKCRLVEFQKSE